MQSEGAVILVVHDVEETRDGIEKLLRVDGYRVRCAREEDDAVARAHPPLPEVILVNLDGPAKTVIARGRRIRQRVGLTDTVPVVIFCVDAVHDGEEVAMGENVHVTQPDNFDQLSQLVHRLLQSTRA